MVQRMEDNDKSIKNNNVVLYANKIPFHTKNVQMEGDTIKW